MLVHVPSSLIFFQDQGFAELSTWASSPIFAFGPRHVGQAAFNAIAEIVNKISSAVS